MGADVRREISNKSILVVGGAGFIGSHLAEAILLHMPSKLVILDNFFSSSPKNLQAISSVKSVEIIKDDARDLAILQNIIESHRVEIVFNCATQALNYSFINPKSAFDVNTKIALNLLELQRRGMFKTLCHFSTSEVYGTANSQKIREDHPLKPTTPYAAGKLAADMAVLSYFQTFGLDCIILRPFNNFGPRQNHKPPLAAIIPLSISRILANKPLEIQGDGMQSRDFIFVEDTAALTLKLFQTIKAGTEVNLTNEFEISILDLVKLIRTKMTSEAEIIFTEKRPSDVKRHLGDSSLLNSIVEFNFTNFEDGLTKTIDWYKEKLNG